MKQQFLQKIILLFFLLTGYCTQSQVKFTASITPAEIGRDEYAQLKLVVENANEVQQIVPPNLKDFVIIGGPNQESGMSMINGAVKKYIALSFILKPKATGNYTIGSAMAKADAGDFKSNPVTLKVTTQATGNNQGVNPGNPLFGAVDPFAEPAPRSAFNEYILRKGENPAEKIKKNMIIRVEADKKSVYVGEPVVATYKLYTRLKSESNMTKNPSFNGFSVLDIQSPSDMGYRTEKFEGREFNVYIIRKVQLYPLLPGNLELGIAEIENNIQFIKAEYLNQQADVANDLFRDLSNAAIPPEGLDMQKNTLQSKPLPVLAKPLPDAGKPAGFKGAVGNFKIESRVENNNFSTDDGGNMAIIISGEGNLQMINAPEISWPPGIEGFDPKSTDDLFKGTVPVSGRKIFEFPFTVSKPGTYLLPAATFSYFDIRDEKYKTVTTNPVEIKVTKGTGRPKAISIKSNEKAAAHLLTRFFNNRLRVVSLIAVLIIIGLIIWLKRDTKREKQLADPVNEEAVKEQEPSPAVALPPVQPNPLLLAEACLYRDETKLFYTHLNQGIKNFLAQKLALQPEAINRKNIAEQLDAKGISNDTSVEVQKLIDDIEWQLYTPFAGQDNRKVMYERTNEMIELLNTCRI
jgi:hypothetical protein